MLAAIERVLGMLNDATVQRIELLHFSELASVGATRAVYGYEDSDAVALVL